MYCTHLYSHAYIYIHLYISLEGLLLKLQYIGHLMQRVNALEKILMLGKIDGKRKRGQLSLYNKWKPWRAAVHGLQRVGLDLATEGQYLKVISIKRKHQFSSVAQLCLIVCDPMDCHVPCLLVHHQFPEFAQTAVYWVSDAIQPSHTLSSLSFLTFNLQSCQHQDLFKWVNSSHQVAKVLEFHLQHQSFQWIPRTDFL